MLKKYFANLPRNLCMRCCALYSPNDLLNSAYIFFVFVTLCRVTFEIPRALTQTTFLTRQYCCIKVFQSLLRKFSLQYIISIKSNKLTPSEAYLVSCPEAT